MNLRQFDKDRKKALSIYNKMIKSLKKSGFECNVYMTYTDIKIMWAAGSATINLPFDPRG